jgi:hypothetical protein
METNNENNYSGFINLFICICLQQRLDQKAGTPISTMGNRHGGPLSRLSDSRRRIQRAKFQNPASHF